MKSQQKAPIYEAIQHHIQNNPAPFHVPGHQMGTVFDPSGYDAYSSILPMDLTEITGLDDLHQPTGAIKEAQELAAQCFHADQTFFLVNGSTVGNMAMIMAACMPGESIILPRNVHKSVMHGCLLGRVRPIYINPRYDERWNIPTIPSLEDIESALIAFPDAKAVFLTNPNYYGMGMDLTKVSELVHAYGKLLLIDEAHGAHFGFHTRYPLSAMQQGCDAAVQSTHKMLPALTMGSMLHIKEGTINVSRVKQILAMLQSSSPSYLILSSLDLARRYMWDQGEKRLEQVYRWVEKFVEKINAESKLFSIPTRSTPSKAFETLDSCKVTIHVNDPSISGFDIKERLEQNGIFVELADLHNVLCVCGVGTTELRLGQLYQTLIKIEQQFSIDSPKKQEQSKQIANIPLPSLLSSVSMSLDEVMALPHEAVSLHSAVGQVSAELVIPYPPGIPIIAWGEMISEEMVQYLQALKREGVTFQGVSDITLNTLQVVRNND